MVIVKNYLLPFLSLIVQGFDKALWNTSLYEDSNSVSFTYLSKDGEEGYPGIWSQVATFIYSPVYLQFHSYIT